MASRSRLPNRQTPAAPAGASSPAAASTGGKGTARGGKWARTIQGKGRRPGTSQARDTASQAAAQRPLQIADPALRHAINILCKQTAANTQELRKLKPLMSDTFIAKVDSELITIVTDEREAYIEHQQGAEAAEKLDIGMSPYLLTSIVNHLATQEGVGAANHREIQKVAKELEETDLEDIEAFICGGVYLEKMQDTGFVKLVLCMEQWKHRRLLVSCLKQLDLKHKPGRAPAGYMENFLSAIIEQTSS